MKVCPNCSREYEDSTKFCRHDGGALQPKSAEKRCPSCGGESDADKKFCRHCGASLEAVAENAPAVQPLSIQQGMTSEEVNRPIVDAVPPSKEKVTQKTPANEIPKGELSAPSESSPSWPLQPLSEPARDDNIDAPPARSRLSDTIPDMKAEPILQRAAAILPSTADELIEPPEAALPRSENKSKRVFTMLVAIVAVAGLFGAGFLFYYAQTKGESVASLIGKMLGGGEQTALETPPPSKIAGVQVIGAEELGFKISGDAATDPNRSEALISEKIKSQLDSLRSLFEQQIRQKPDLMGSMTLRLAISPTGEVTKVVALATQIEDETFKQSVIDNASKWRFPEASSGFVQVTYPLLFLPPGMDAAALLKIVKGLPQTNPPIAAEPVPPSNQNPPAEEAGPQSPPQTPATQPSARAEPNKTPGANSQARSVERIPAPLPLQPPAQVETPERYPMVPYETITDTVVHREASEDSPTIASIPAGTKVYVVAIRGDWLQLRSKVGNPPGYIKKESAAYMGR
jgi:hypothetical protein